MAVYYIKCNIHLFTLLLEQEAKFDIGRAERKKMESEVESKGEINGDRSKQDKNTWGGGGGGGGGGVLRGDTKRPK